MCNLFFSKHQTGYTLKKIRILVLCNIPVTHVHAPYTMTCTLSVQYKLLFTSKNDLQQSFTISNQLPGQLVTTQIRIVGIQLLWAQHIVNS